MLRGHTAEALMKCRIAMLGLALLLLCTLKCVAQTPPRSGDNLETLLKRLKSPFSSEVVGAARGIERLGPAAKSAVPDLNHALTRSSFSDERIALANALAAMGPAAEEAVPNLALNLKRAGFPQERQAIMQALAKIGPGARPAVPTLVDLLRTGMPDDAKLAAEVLGEIGPGAREALPTLRQLASTGFTTLKPTAAAAVKKIQANDLRFGVRDGARLFNPNQVARFNQELQELTSREHIGVVIETQPNIPAEYAALTSGGPRPEGFGLIDAWAQERVRVADYNGLFILICRNPLQVAVTPTPTVRQAFDQQGCQKLRDQILARINARQDDEVLRDVTAFMKGRALTEANPKLESRNPK
jgi:hypothetical protein